jgi:hypothetical protein
MVNLKLQVTLVLFLPKFPSLPPLLYDQCGHGCSKSSVKKLIVDPKLWAIDICCVA